jgi:hypothetical protein
MTSHCSLLVLEGATLRVVRQMLKMREKQKKVKVMK